MISVKCHKGTIHERPKVYRELVKGFWGCDI